VEKILIDADQTSTHTSFLWHDIGRAYLFDQCVNVIYGKPEERRLMTGTVCTE
jgi:hypothetical protein